MAQTLGHDHRPARLGGMLRKITRSQRVAREEADCQPAFPNTVCRWSNGS